MLGTMQKVHAPGWVSTEFGQTPGWLPSLSLPDLTNTTTLLPDTSLASLSLRIRPANSTKSSKIPQSPSAHWSSSPPISRNVSPSPHTFTSEKAILSVERKEDFSGSAFFHPANRFTVYPGTKGDYCLPVRKLDPLNGVPATTGFDDFNCLLAVTRSSNLTQSSPTRSNCSASPALQHWTAGDFLLAIDLVLATLDFAIGTIFPVIGASKIAPSTIIRHVAQPSPPGCAPHAQHLKYKPSNPAPTEPLPQAAMPRRLEEEFVGYVCESGDEEENPLKVFNLGDLPGTPSSGEETPTSSPRKEQPKIDGAHLADRVLLGFLGGNNHIAATMPLRPLPILDTGNDGIRTTDINNGGFDIDKELEDMDTTGDGEPGNGEKEAQSNDDRQDGKRDGGSNNGAGEDRSGSSNSTGGAAPGGSAGGSDGDDGNDEEKNSRNNESSKMDIDMTEDEEKENEQKSDSKDLMIIAQEGLDFTKMDVDGASSLLGLKRSQPKDSKQAVSLDPASPKDQNDASTCHNNGASGSPMHDSPKPELATISQPPAPVTITSNTTSPAPVRLPSIVTIQNLADAAMQRIQNLPPQIQNLPPQSVFSPPRTIPATSGPVNVASGQAQAGYGPISVRERQSYSHPATNVYYSAQSPPTFQPSPSTVFSSGSEAGSPSYSQDSAPTQPYPVGRSQPHSGYSYANAPGNNYFEQNPPPGASGSPSSSSTVSPGDTEVVELSPDTYSSPPGSTPRHGLYRCEYPGCKAAPFQTQYLLNSHANVHSASRPHFCSVPGCPRGEGGKGFKRKNEMIRHGLVHDSPGYICPFCPPDKEHKYPRPDNLQRHVRANHPDKNKDDRKLRDVLAQRNPGNRGRRRRGAP